MASHRAAVLRLVAPPLLAIALFAAAIGWLVIPATEEALLERKRETLRAIVATAISLCERHHADETAGRIGGDEARARAAADLRALRWGEAGRDYLWAVDAGPRVIAHPLRPDLEGQEVGSYADPDGVRLFAQAVATVAASGEGFVAYRWQKTDAQALVVPKLSYVRGFAPWGWTVGSGIYLDDVHAELSRSARTLGWLTAAIGAAVALLVAVGLRQGWTSERARRAAEAELERARARAEALAHAASEAVWLVIDGRIAGRNRRADELCQAHDDPAALFADSADRVLAAGPTSGPRQVVLAGRDGPLPALVEADTAVVHGQQAVVLAARPLGDAAGAPAEAARRAAAEAQNDAAALAQAGLLAQALPLAVPAPTAPLTATPAETLAAMAAGGGSAALLTAPDGGIAGLVTAGDLARRGGATAYAAMSAPVRVLPAEASLAAAADAMAEGRVGRLAITSPDGPRLLTAARLLDALRQGPGQLVAAAARADQAGLASVRRRLDAWMASLARVGVDPELAAAEGTRVADAVLARCATLAADGLGAPPAACAFLVVGSQGRGELLPGGDQDNALVHADDADPRWFAAFASDVVARYHAAGWPRCHGGCHAADARWTLPLSAWRERYRGWIARAEPQALLEAAVFFDARPAWGDAPLASELAAAVRNAVAERPVFLVQLAQATLQARSPLGLFGGIRPDDERHGTTDLKLSMLHIAGFARVQALRLGLAATGTGARLRACVAAGAMPAEAADEALAGWRFLLGLRLRQRTSAGGGDHLDPERLGAWERTQLKRALAGIEALRERLRADLARIGA
jgi:CBS domain-containing protein